MKIKLVCLLAIVLFFLSVISCYGNGYDMVNYQRSIRKLNTLQVDKQLQKNATRRACEIKEWSHNGWEKYFDNTNYTVYGENLSVDFTYTQAMRAWMRSPSHKENILYPYYTHIGIGYCGRYIVQFFGGYTN